MGVTCYYGAMEIEERFWAKVAWRVPEGECWEWTASLDRRGYGKFRVSGRTAIAHRVAYELEVCETKLELDHLCRNRKCVNPGHLEPVEHVVNVRRSDIVGKAKHHGKGAWQRAKTRCPAGHEYNDMNTRKYIYKGRPARVCRTCERERHQKP